MEKYLVDFVYRDGVTDCGIVNSENLDDAKRDAHQLVECSNGGLVTKIELWSDAVLATVDPDDWNNR